MKELRMWFYCTMGALVGWFSLLPITWPIFKEFRASSFYLEHEIIGETGILLTVGVILYVLISLVRFIFFDHYKLNQSLRGKSSAVLGDRRDLIPIDPKEFEFLEFRIITKDDGTQDIVLVDSRTNQIKYHDIRLNRSQIEKMFPKRPG